MIKPLRFSALTITLSYVAFSMVVLATFALPLWFSWHETIEEGRVKILQAGVVRLTGIFNKQGIDKLASEINLLSSDEPDDTESLMLLTNADLQRLAGNMSRWPKEIGSANGRFTMDIDVNGRPVRASLVTTTLSNGDRLLVANDVGKYRALELSFVSGLCAAAIIVLLLGMLGGLLIRRTLLRKVKDISQATTAIIQGNFSHRLPAISGESELNTLVDTQNRMLDQIERLISGIRTVSDAIAHDLRTPLAELRSRLEELFVTRPDTEETFTGIEGAIGDVDHVMSIFNALLRLAEIDAGTRRSGFVEVDIVAIAGEVAELYQALAESEECTLSFTATAAPRMQGDPLLLAQAVANLIDNALKYAKKNGSIHVSTWLDAHGNIKIAVADNGPGIPDDQKARVLDRFYRGDASRGTPGVGLGLSLVSSVAKLHGGRVELADNHPGLVATLILAPQPTFSET